MASTNPHLDDALRAAGDPVCPSSATSLSAGINGVDQIGQPALQPGGAQPLTAPSAYPAGQALLLLFALRWFRATQADSHAWHQHGRDNEEFRLIMNQVTNDAVHGEAGRKAAVKAR